MRPLELVEQQDSPPYHLNGEELAELRKGLRDSLDIRPSFENDNQYILNPRCWVGKIQLPTLTVRVTPKLPVSRVLFLWSYGLDPNHWRDRQTSFGQARDLVEAVAHAFVRELDKALKRGVLHGYRGTEDSLKTLRGRILLREQWAHSLRLRSELAVAYDEFTTDILENRLLKAATERIRRIRIDDKSTRDSLNRHRRALDDVSHQHFARGRLPAVHFIHLNRHYEGAIFFAKMILSAMSFELPDGSVRASGLLINMNTVFEAFVRVALREALHEPESRFGKKVLHFGEGRTTPVEPDLVWWAQKEAPRFVGDAKYKRLDDNLQHPDLYQMLAYIVAANLTSGMLIYPKSEAPGISLIVANIGRTIETCTLDISAEPRDILASVNDIARRVREIADQGPAGRRAA